MKARDIALLAVAILFPVGVVWFIMSPAAMRWVINGLLVLPPGMLTIGLPIAMGVGVSIWMIALARKPKPTEEDAGPDSFGRL